MCDWPVLQARGAAIIPQVAGREYDAVRLVFAAVLIVAGMLKSQQAATDLATQVGLRGALWIKTLLVHFELLFG
ncbi:MAG: hypothetical protein NTU53_09645 [Planctomycetota bacterium]|nr:hypothetical protein [Planctomycetota bacterium]